LFCSLRLSSFFFLLLLIRTLLWVLRWPLGGPSVVLRPPWTHPIEGWATAKTTLGQRAGHPLTGSCDDNSPLRLAAQARFDHVDPPIDLVCRRESAGEHALHAPLRAGACHRHLPGSAPCWFEKFVPSGWSGWPACGTIKRCLAGLGHVGLALRLLTLHY
jgi:hypothetical protein